MAAKDRREVRDLKDKDSKEAKVLMEAKDRKAANKGSRVANKDLKEGKAHKEDKGPKEDRVHKKTSRTIQPRLRLQRPPRTSQWSMLEQASNHRTSSQPDKDRHQEAEVSRILLKEGQEFKAILKPGSSRTPSRICRTARLKVKASLQDSVSHFLSKCLSKLSKAGSLNTTLPNRP